MLWRITLSENPKLWGAGSCSAATTPPPVVLPVDDTYVLDDDPELSTVLGTPRRSLFKSCDQLAALADAQPFVDAAEMVSHGVLGDPKT
jgi:hypothetical protein